MRLSRERDGAGDAGSMCIQLRIDEAGKLETRRPNGPDDILVGWAVRVGSLSGRTFSSQDYWTTTYVTEILETGKRENGDQFVRFKTGNSVYLLEE